MQHDDEGDVIGVADGSHCFTKLQLFLQVEAVGRLVHEDDLWFSHQCLGDGDELLLSAGEPRKMDEGELFQMEQGEDFHDGVRVFRRHFPMQARQTPQQHRLKDGEPAGFRFLLRQVGDARHFFFVAHALQVAIIAEDLARGGQETEEAL